jgi:hypothetical protein
VQSDVQRMPLVIAMDYAVYATFFGTRSPIDRGQVLVSLCTISQLTSKQTRITLDLDISPLAAQAEQQATVEGVPE